MAVRSLSLGAASVAATLDRLFRLLRRLQPADQVSLTAASTLRRLENGEQRLTDLALLEDVSQPAMTQLVSRLERDRLVERVRDRGDGRVVRIRITGEGRELLRRRRTARERRLGELLAALSPAERKTILAALPALDRLVEMGHPGS